MSFTWVYKTFLVRLRLWRHEKWLKLLAFELKFSDEFWRSRLADNKLSEHSTKSQLTSEQRSLVTAVFCRFYQLIPEQAFWTRFVFYVKLYFLPLVGVAWKSCYSNRVDVLFPRSRENLWSVNNTCQLTAVAKLSRTDVNQVSLSLPSVYLYFSLLLRKLREGFLWQLLEQKATTIRLEVPNHLWNFASDVCVFFSLISKFSLIFINKTPLFWLELIISLQ